MIWFDILTYTICVLFVWAVYDGSKRIVRAIRNRKVRKHESGS
ncbi:membrane protein [Gordonia phage Secretariat]|uniref:Membrane protein n=1 Tax=Gordonia phage Secretariat TaxID=2725616 RepID=A0A6M3SUL4_9CAUD|nr:membrane protein [Gordonia phage Secretariat]QJD49623.1 membrane protein [Gordonia phage Secretariat]